MTVPCPGTAPARPRETRDAEGAALALDLDREAADLPAIEEELLRGLEYDLGPAGAGISVLEIDVEPGRTVGHGGYDRETESDPF